MQADMSLLLTFHFTAGLWEQHSGWPCCKYMHHLGSPSLTMEGHPYDPDVRASAWLGIRHRHTDFCQWTKELLHGLVAAHPF
jgi:hypothetical protein